MKNLFLTSLFFSFLSINISAQWIEQVSGITDNLRSVSAVNNNIVWASGYYGKVLKSTNGGINWINVSGNGIPPTYNLSCIFALSQEKAVVIGQNNYVYRTTNGGNNWVEVLSTSRYMDALWFRNENEGVLIGDPDNTGGFFFIRLTSNGGSNWYQGDFLQSNAGGSFKNAIYGINNRIWFGAEERVFYSLNNGWSWGSQFATGNDIYSIYFKDSLTGMAGGYSYSIPQLRFTTNSGTTWTSLPSPGTGFPVGITFNNNAWWCAKSNSEIYVSTNNGLNWILDYNNPSTSFSHLTKARNGNRMWAVGSNGKIMKNEGVVGLIPVSNKVPNTFQLYQNYPNPFNPSTKIKMDISPSSCKTSEANGVRAMTNVKLVIYNVLGKEITALVNEQLYQGTYEVEWNASEFPSGIYYYRLMVLWEGTSSEVFSDTKKMILLK